MTGSLRDAIDRAPMTRFPWLAIGRAGAILAPAAAGALLDAGWTPRHLHLAAGAVLVGTAAVSSLLRTAPQTRATSPSSHPHPVPAEGGA